MRAYDSTKEQRWHWKCRYSASSVQSTSICVWETCGTCVLKLVVVFGCVCVLVSSPSLSLISLSNIIYKNTPLNVLCVLELCVYVCMCANINIERFHLRRMWTRRSIIVLWWSVCAIVSPPLLEDKTITIHKLMALQRVSIQDGESVLSLSILTHKLYICLYYIYINLFLFFLFLFSLLAHVFHLCQVRSR